MPSSDPCIAMLELAAYNKVGIKATSNIAQAMYTFFLSEEFKSASKKGEFGASLPIPLPDGGPVLDLGLNHSDEAHEAFTSRLKKIKKEAFESNYSVDITKAFVNDDTRRMFEHCVPPATSDISVHHVVAGDQVEVTVRWNIKVKTDASPIVRTVFDRPLVAVEPIALKKGARVPIDGIRQHYTWPKGRSSPVILSVTTSRGGGHATIGPDVADAALPAARKLLLSFEMSEKAGRPQTRFGPLEEVIPRGASVYLPGGKAEAPYGADKMVGRVTVDENGRFGLETKSIHTANVWLPGSKVARGMADASSSWCHVRAVSLD